MKESILISIIIIIIYIFLFINRNNVIYIESNTGTKFLVHKDKDKNDIPLLVENDLTPIRSNYRITKFLNRVFDGKKN
jgi:hypothetical protein